MPKASGQLEPSIWSRDTGQRKPCFDRCQLTKTWMSNIKTSWSMAAKVSSKLEPAIWSGDTLAYMWGWTFVRTYGDQKPNFLAQMGYHIFLPMVLLACDFGARSSAKTQRSTCSICELPCSISERVAFETMIYFGVNPLQ